MRVCVGACVRVRACACVRACMRDGEDGLMLLVTLHGGSRPGAPRTWGLHSPPARPHDGVLPARAQRHSRRGRRALAAHVRGHGGARRGRGARARRPRPDIPRERAAARRRWLGRRAARVHGGVRGRARCGSGGGGAPRGEAHSCTSARDRAPHSPVVVPAARTAHGVVEVVSAARRVLLLQSPRCAQVWCGAHAHMGVWCRSGAHLTPGRGRQRPCILFVCRTRPSRDLCETMAGCSRPPNAILLLIRLVPFSVSIQTQWELVCDMGPSSVCVLLRTHSTPIMKCADLSPQSRQDHRQVANSAAQ